MPWIILLGLVALAAIGLGTTREMSLSAPAGGLGRTLDLARRWGAVFGAPVAVLLTIAHEESGHDPASRDLRKRRGAWGLFGQMADEVPGKLARIAKSWGHLPAVRETIALWHGEPEDLLQPELNAMLAAWQVGKLARKFGGNVTLILAGYHQGQGAVEQRIAAGLPAVDPQRQPRGAEYLRRAARIYPLYEGVS